jgi:hypothetical protein
MLQRYSLEEEGEPLGFETIAILNYYYIQGIIKN